MDPAAIYSCMVGDSCTEEAIDHELADMGATPDVASTSAVMTRRCSSEHAAAKLRPARTDLLQLYFHVVRHFRPPASFRLSLGLPLDPLGVLAAGVELCPPGVDPARGLVRADLQLIQPGGAAIVGKPRFGGLGGRSFRLGCVWLVIRLGPGYSWPGLL